MTRLLSLALLASFVAVPAVAQTTDPAPTIVETAVATDALSTLVAAVQAAELAGVLSGEGPFTVFAPTNDAFAALPAGTVETLLEPANREQLAAILTYHVVAGQLMAADLADGQTLTTVQGQTLTVKVDGATVTVNGVPVVQADVAASNGVVHVIGGVLLPTANP